MLLADLCIVDRTAYYWWACCSLCEFFWFFFLQTNTYQHQKAVQAAQGVKLIAKDLERALAGLPLYAVHDHDKDEIEYFKVSSTVLMCFVPRLVLAF